MPDLKEVINTNQIIRKQSDWLIKKHDDAHLFSIEPLLSQAKNEAEYLELINKMMQSNDPDKSISPNDRSAVIIHCLNKLTLLLKQAGNTDYLSEREQEQIYNQAIAFLQTNKIIAGEKKVSPVNLSNIASSCLEELSKNDNNSQFKNKLQLMKYSTELKFLDDIQKYCDTIRLPNEGKKQFYKDNIKLGAAYLVLQKITEEELKSGKSSVLGNQLRTRILGTGVEYTNTEMLEGIKTLISSQVKIPKEIQSFYDKKLEPQIKDKLDSIKLRSIS